MKMLSPTMTHKYVKRVVEDNMHMPSMDDRIKGRWSRGDMQYLLKHHKDMYIDDIALELGRTLVAAKAKAFLMGCSIKSKGKSNE